MIEFDHKNQFDMNINTGNGLCIALGNFDGVHIGHMALIDKILEEKSRVPNSFSAVWSFESHPSNFIESREKVLYITLPSEKKEIFAQRKVDFFLNDRFEDIRNLPPEKFIEDILIKKYNCITAVCGFNFRFGKYGSGTPELLCELMKAHNRKGIIIPPVLCMNRIVSSSTIRLLIETGYMEEAEMLLGRPFSIRFPVIHGKRLGRTIGIPTINQEFPSKHIKPKNGIYSCAVYIGDDMFLGVSNVGSRPTVNSDETKINCETHIINYNGWLYGKEIKVCFYKRLRDEKKFESLELLKQAVSEDIKNTVEYFSKK